MAITVSDVRHLAKLANLAVDDAEAALMADKLQAIVGYVEQLSEVDTTGIEPLANVAGLTNVTRPDVAGPMFTPTQALANSAQKNDIAFLVPKVVER